MENPIQPYVPDNNRYWVEYQSSDHSFAIYDKLTSSMAVIYADQHPEHEITCLYRRRTDRGYKPVFDMNVWVDHVNTNRPLLAALGICKARPLTCKDVHDFFTGKGVQP